MTLTWHTLRQRRTQLLNNRTIFELNAARFLKKLGIPFIMQQIIYPYIVDFVGTDHNFILELDGTSHDETDEYDDRRSQYLEERGFNVYRLENHEVNVKSIQEIIDQVPYVGSVHMRQLIYKANYDRERRIHRSGTSILRLPFT